MFSYLHSVLHVCFDGRVRTAIHFMVAHVRVTCVVSERRHRCVEGSRLGCCVHSLTNRTVLARRAASVVRSIVEQFTLALGLGVAALGADQVVGLMSLSIHSLVLVLRTLVEFLSHDSTFLS